MNYGIIWDPKYIIDNILSICYFDNVFQIHLRQSKIVVSNMSGYGSNSGRKDSGGGICQRRG